MVDNLYVIEMMAKSRENVLDIYDIFSIKFPAQTALWNELAKEEKSHIEMLKNLAVYLKKSGSDPVFRVLDTNKAYSLEDFLEEKIKIAANSRFNSKEALEFVLDIENNFLGSKIFKPSDGDMPEMRKVYGALTDEMKKHAQLIEEQIKNRAI
jgi:hypothetical protein